MLHHDWDCESVLSIYIQQKIIQRKLSINPNLYISISTTNKSPLVLFRLINIKILCIRWFFKRERRCYYENKEILKMSEIGLTFYDLNRDKWTSSLWGCFIANWTLGGWENYVGSSSESLEEIIRIMKRANKKIEWTCNIWFKGSSY